MRVMMFTNTNEASFLNKKASNLTKDKNTEIHGI
jgi:hypothetical protein